MTIYYKLFVIPGQCNTLMRQVASYYGSHVRLQLYGLHVHTGVPIIYLFLLITMWCLLRTMPTNTEVFSLGL